jgi:hypothetical protein
MPRLQLGSIIFGLIVGYFLFGVMGVGTGRRR